MNGPSDDLRSTIYDTLQQTRDASDAQAEELLNEILSQIDEAVAADLAESSVEVSGEDAAFQALASVEAWTGLASAAVARVYAPASPWPRQFAGWTQSVAQRLRQLAQRLTPVLQNISRALGALAFTIGLAFPWGVSVSLSWP